MVIEDNIFGGDAIGVTNFGGLEGQIGVEAFDSANDYEDFGGGHPDSNFTYARELAASMGLIKSSPQVEPTEYGIAVDGKANRDMILSKRFFVIPSDLVAIIATNAYEVIKKNSGDDTSSFTYEVFLAKIKCKMKQTLS
ncbi:hypothetical protein GH714_011338 [Hevea brasiliensis]|uniref:Uncharacterized protein n=1 Tax=Hevea brasiliensis TaxID=3981 RepID=A0A6A6LS46_HEVBR|nr:hypothetical protein GH714_011338 [Hevea brasiliensis]